MSLFYFVSSSFLELDRSWRQHCMHCSPVQFESTLESYAEYTKQFILSASEWLQANIRNLQIVGAVASLLLVVQYLQSSDVGLFNMQEPH